MQPRNENQVLTDTSALQATQENRAGLTTRINTTQTAFRKILNAGLVSIFTQVTDIS